MIAQTIILVITIIILALNLIREIMVYRDIKSNFYCKHCSTFNAEISRLNKCVKCHRTLKIKCNSWEHLLIHRINWIPAYTKSEVFKWKDYKKLSIIEITVNCIAISIVGLGLIITVL